MHVLCNNAVGREPHCQLMLLSGECSNTLGT
jgi:hypothetical protein